MRQNTKELIWKESLNLFSIYGYEGVSVKKIADAAGIRDSSLYKHFKSKQEIFDYVVKNVTQRMNEQYENFALPTGKHIDENYKIMKREVLEKLLFQMFFFFLEDNIVSKFRRMLTIEQYKDSSVSKLYHNYFIDGAIEHETKLFQQFIDSGFFIKGNPNIMALHFYSPIFLLLYRYDCKEFEKQEVKLILNELLDNFSKMYVSSTYNGG